MNNVKQLYHHLARTFPLLIAASAGSQGTLFYSYSELRLSPQQTEIGVESGRSGQLQREECSRDDLLW